MIGLKSKITQKILNYFFLNKSAELYLNQMARVLDADRGNLVKKLRELEKEGILKSEFRGNQRYYMLNNQYPFIKEYEQIILKTVGFEAELKSVFSKIKGIKHLYIFGSYAANCMSGESDIDLLVVGDCPHLLIEERLVALRKKTGREINVVDFGEEEYQNKIESNDPFIADVLSHSYIKII